MKTKSYNTIKGDYGENLSINYLKDKKYTIMQTKFRNKLGEIDIIAKDKDIIVFVEVKFKESAYYGLPREMINSHKKNRIRQVAISYLIKNKLYEKTNVRFDVIDIIGEKITHIMNAF